MNTFGSLLKIRKGKAPNEAQGKARSDFPRRVAQSKLRLRNPMNSVAPLGRCFIVGVATFAMEELSLLDQLEESLESDKSETADVEVFDVLDCQKMSDFEKYIPGIGNVYRTPVIGVVIDGELVDHASGLSEVASTLRRFKLLK